MSEPGRDSLEKADAENFRDLSRYSYIPEENRKIEELKLLALAYELSTERLTASLDSYSPKTFIRSFALKSELERSESEKLLAFATLGKLLDYEDGDWGCLPPHSRWWKLFRELFLECSQFEIAGEFQSSLPNPKTARLVEFTDPVPRPQAKRVQKKLLQGGGVFAGQEDYEITRRLCRIRIRNYDILSVDSIRGELIRKGEVRTEADWGAILEVLDAIDKSVFPSELDIPQQRAMTPEEEGGKTLLEFLIASEKESRGSPKIPGLYEKAGRSLRKFLFNASIEECTRLISSALKGGPGSLEDIEREFLIVQVIRNPRSIVEDQRLAQSFAYFLEDEGSEFFGKLHRRSPTIEKGEPKRQRRKDLVPVLARYWIDPHFPLFLMSHEGIKNFLGALCFDGGTFDASYESALDGLLRKGGDETCLSLFRERNGLIDMIGFDVSQRKLNSLEFASGIKAGATANEAYLYFSAPNRMPKLESLGWRVDSEEK